MLFKTWGYGIAGIRGQSWGRSVTELLSAPLLDSDFLLGPYRAVPSWIGRVMDALGAGEDPVPGDRAALARLRALRLLIAPPVFLASLAESQAASPALRALLSGLQDMARQRGLTALAERAWSLLTAEPQALPTRPFGLRVDPAKAPSGAPLPLSIVVTSRNDDHGGDLLRRMQVFLDCLLEQCAETGPRCELIIVEWNPPADRPRLSEALRLPDRHPRCSLRVLTVPGALHDRLAFAAQQPLYQMVAKNAGIRRALGRHVLVTNIDIVFSEALADFLARGVFEAGRIYRVDRNDVDAAVPLGRGRAAVLQHCRRGLLRANRRLATLDATGAMLETMHGALGEGDDLPALHLNACGDFQLMARDDWFALRGYAELEGYSLHIDSLLAFSAHFAGITEQVLPPDHCAYHIDHGGGWTPQATLDRSLSGRGLPRMRYADLLLSAQLMAQMGQGLVFNGPAWGLAGQTLAEERFLAPLPAVAEQERASRSPDALIPLSGDADSRRSGDQYAGLLLDAILAEVERRCPTGSRPVVLWGAGPKGRQLAARWLAAGRDLAALLDQQAGAAPQAVLGLPLRHPEMLAATKGSPRPFVIVGASFHDAIAERLAAWGYREDRDYYAPF